MQRSSGGESTAERTRRFRFGLMRHIKNEASQKRKKHWWLNSGAITALAKQRWDSTRCSEHGWRPFSNVNLTFAAPPTAVLYSGLSIFNCWLATLHRLLRLIHPSLPSFNVTSTQSGLVIMFTHPPLLHADFSLVNPATRNWLRAKKTLKRNVSSSIGAQSISAITSLFLSQTAIFAIVWILKWCNFPSDETDRNRNLCILRFSSFVMIRYDFSVRFYNFVTTRYDSLRLLTMRDKMQFCYHSLLSSRQGPIHQRKRIITIT